MTAQLRIFLGILIGMVTVWTATARALPPPVSPPGVSGKDDNSARRIDIPASAADAPFELWVARTKVKLPFAVLVLCLDKGQDAKALLGDPAWRNFAEDHGLGLVAVTMTAHSIPALRRYFSPEKTRQAALDFRAAIVQEASHVQPALNHEFGAETPLLLYGWPQQAALAAELLAAKPKRVLGWGLRAPDYLPDTGVATPPGIVACYKEDKRDYDALMKDFAKGRKLGEPLTWIALPGDKPKGSDQPELDVFVRNYFAALLSSKLRTDQWQNIETKQSVSVTDSNTHPELASYLPRPALASGWAALHTPGGPEIAQEAIVEREVDTFQPAQPKLHLYLRKPVNASDPAAKIEGVLAFCTWDKSRSVLIARLQNRNDFLVRYADNHHLALLTWDTAQAWSITESADQRTRQDNFQDDLGFDKLANAWERGVHAVCSEAQLPETDFLLYGISRGAQWAHRLALRKPQHFLAVHIHINSSYDQPTPEAKSVLWLQTTGDREAGYEAAKRFYARCREMGYPIIFKAGENLGHEASGQIDNLGLRFFDYALSIKASRDAARTISTKSLLGKHDLPSTYALSGLGQAPFYADFINQDVYRVEEKEMIPEHQRVPLPTKALARAWGGSFEASALTLVSDPKMVPAAPPSAKSTGQSQTNAFGSGSPSDEPLSDAATSTRIVSNEDLSKPGDHAAAAVSSLDVQSASMATSQNVVSKDQLAMSLATAQQSGTEQTKNLPGVVLVSKSRKLQESAHPVPTESPWSKQVAQIMREQSAAHPSFPQEYEHSFQRAAAAYPALAEVGSATNNAFLAEYHRLHQANDNILGETTWPEQVARKVSGRTAAP